MIISGLCGRVVVDVATNDPIGNGYCYQIHLPGDSDGQMSIFMHPNHIGSCAVETHLTWKKKALRTNI